MKQLTSPRTGKMQEIVQGAGNGELEIPDFSFGFMQTDHARIAADALKKRFSLLSEHICSIFLLFSSKSKNGNILLDIIEVRCSGNDREISLNMPAKNYLDGRFTMYLGYLSDDRLNNAQLDIAPPNRNQQVM